LIEFKLPFYSSDPLDLRNMILNTPHPPLSRQCSDSLKKVVDRMLEKVCLFVDLFMGLGIRKVREGGCVYLLICLWVWE
jgi:hypothetical protein